MEVFYLALPDANKTFGSSGQPLRKGRHLYTALISTRRCDPTVERAPQSKVAEEGNKAQGSAGIVASLETK